MNKRRITLQIANNPLTIVTDEDEAFVDELTDELNSRFSSLMKANIRITPLDAALLCSIDYLSEKKKADAEIESLKKELDLCKSRLKQIELFSASAVSESDMQAQLSPAISGTTAEASDGNTGTSSNVTGSDIKKAKSSRAQTRDRHKPSAKTAQSESGNTSGTGATAEEKIRALEKYLESKKSSDVASAARDAREREEKIKYIESLLRGGSKSRSEKSGEKKTGAESGLKDVSPSENSSSDIPKERNDG